MELSMWYLSQCSKMFQVLQHFGLSDYRCSGFSRNISLQGSSLLNECLLVPERSLLFILLFYNQKTPKNPSFIAIISQSFLYPFSLRSWTCFPLKKITECFIKNEMQEAKRMTVHSWLLRQEETVAELDNEPSAS